MTALKQRKSKTIQGVSESPLRKRKFQADLAPAEDRIVRALKQELQLSSNSDFLSDALALYRWAASERRLGRRIISESLTGDRQVLVFPRLERLAPDTLPPHVDIKWNERELARLAELASSEKAPQPAELLIKALRG
jgi:hypothetical protein